MIKRLNRLMILWLCFFTIQCSGENRNLKYQIYFNSGTNNELEIKEEVLSIYQEIVKGVDRDCRANLVEKNIELFNQIEGAKSEIIQDTLIITFGNGQGMEIHGELDWVMCHPDVKMKSWLLEMLGH